VERIFNFSAGPAVLPAEVLKQARNEILNWHDSGMSIMEMSHRGREFTSVVKLICANWQVFLTTIKYCSSPVALPASSPWYQ